MPLPRLQVSPNGHFLVSSQTGAPVFLTCDTAWGLQRTLQRPDVNFYLQTRKKQGFNAIATVAFSVMKSAYNDAPPFLLRPDGKPDMTRPVQATGPQAAYGFWEHLDWCIDRADALGLYVVLLPTWGYWVSGSYDGKDQSDAIFTPETARVYGERIGNRYKNRTNLLWMLGGDRAAVDFGKDFRPVWRAMAGGLLAGAGKNVLASFHPRKDAAQSSEWFHGDPWLSVNSVQEWPDVQVKWMETDWNKTPPKPTWLFEGRYEAYRPAWGDWQARFQAYQTVFGGAFGHTYGHERVFKFAPGSSWKNYLFAPGAVQMGYLAVLMNLLTPKQYLARVPDNALVDGDNGKAERAASHRITATRGTNGDFALFYSGDGRPIPVKMSRLASRPFDAFWMNPRTGRWRVDSAEYDAPRPFERAVTPDSTEVKTFSPPGGQEDGNDWVLWLR